MNIDAIVIGASAGGFKALASIIPKISNLVVTPIIIAQHIAPDAENYIVEYLDEKSDLRVKEVEEKEKIMCGTIYIAPPNYHVLVESDKTFSLSVEERVSFSRPSIDILFETAAEVYKENLAGLILTGANSDGTKGLQRIKYFGGTVIVQEPTSAEVKQMPESAIHNVEWDYVLDLPDIIKFINDLGK